MNTVKENSFSFFFFVFVKKIAVIGKKLLKGRSLTTHFPFCPRRHWLKLEKERMSDTQKEFSDRKARYISKDKGHTWENSISNS